MIVRMTWPDGEEYEVSAETAARVTKVRGLDHIIRGLAPDPPKQFEKCPHCGWEDSDYTSTGYVGCPLCYSSLKSLRRA